MRIIKRKFGREGESSFSTDASHRIKIGWDIRPKGAQRPKPQRLHGFLICHNSVVEGRAGFTIDDVAMQRLGFTPEQAQAAITGGLKAPGNLPTELRFTLYFDAVKAQGGGWEYPGSYSEGYSCWNKDGLFCEGQGETAMRKQEDGTKKEIVCNPNGKEGVPAAEFCEYSVSGACKAHHRLIVLLYYQPDGGAPFAPAPPVPLADNQNARFRLDTSSEYGGMQIGEELDRIAERLDGRIAGITGTLTFTAQRKRHAGGVGITPQLMIAFNEAEVRAKEQQLRNWYLESSVVPPPKFLAGPGERPETIEYRPVEVNGDGDETATPLPDPEPAKVTIADIHPRTSGPEVLTQGAVELPAARPEPEPAEVTLQASPDRPSEPEAVIIDPNQGKKLQVPFSHGEAVTVLPGHGIVNADLPSAQAELSADAQAKPEKPADQVIYKFEGIVVDVMEGTGLYDHTERTRYGIKVSPLTDISKVMLFGTFTESIANRARGAAASEGFEGFPAEIQYNKIVLGGRPRNEIVSLKIEDVPEKADRPAQRSPDRKTTETQDDLPY